MKRLFSFSVTSTFTFILSVLAILVIAVSAPGMVQAVLDPTASPGDAQPGNSIMASSYYGPKVNPAANFGSLTDNGTAAYMGIGTNSPVSPLHIYSTTSTQPETIDLSGSQPITAQWNDYCNTGGAFSGSGFLGRFARGTKASPANVQVGDRLGFNVFGGWVGSWFHTAAIEAMVDSGTVSGSSLPTYMRFLTTPSGSTTRAERMRITKDGNVCINTTNPYTGTALTAYSTDTSGTGVFGYTLTNGNGVYGKADGGGSGVKGYSLNGFGVEGYSANSYAGYFNGRIKVNGPIATVYRLSGTNTAVDETDSIVAVNASVAPLTVTLPSASGIEGRTYTIKRVNATNSVTIDPDGSETIDGAASKTLSSQWQYITVVSDGANWLITANN